LSVCARSPVVGINFFLLTSIAKQSLYAGDASPLAPCEFLLHVCCGGKLARTKIVNAAKMQSRVPKPNLLSLMPQTNWPGSRGPAQARGPGRRPRLPTTKAGSVYEISITDFVILPLQLFTLP